ncbi:prephenate dehydratase [Pedomonas mirosovicensis]|uniref:prephenate dehydratase n=1 Tax=Pedomonas mirosovicensis TaxID=2908641 RepID=UPI002167153E|nr:prephenate dehydratase [Pedomonas mirosovicensis]MCH8685769.1 prephenate dehydratase [Pedomonas mirosovicensis]
MQIYPEPARELVSRMTAKATALPSQAVAFQGAPGAFSHLATCQVFPEGLPLPCFSFDEAFEAVESGKADRAVIPIENSYAGRVAEIHFLLPASRLHIVGEHFLRVRHSLLAPKGAKLENVRQAFSHPQALSQTRKWCAARGIDQVPYADTAGAAALVAEKQEPGTSAVASSFAGQIYDLDILAEGIEDVAHNTTRFVVLAREPITPDPAKGPLMTTIFFEVRNIPAALFKALGGFATNGINITKLESYQREGTFTATDFFADFEGSPEDPAVQRALEELEFHSKRLRIFGTYAQALTRLHPDALDEQASG